MFDVFEVVEVKKEQLLRGLDLTIKIGECEGGSCVLRIHCLSLQMRLDPL